MPRKRPRLIFALTLVLPAWWAGLVRALTNDPALALDPALAIARDGDIIGTTAADVEDWSYCDGEQDRRLPNLLVEIEGGASGYSDAVGDFVLPHEGSDPVVVISRLRGRWVEVTNVLAPDPILTGVATPGVPIELRWDDSSALDAERSAYLHANRIHDAVASIDPGWTAPDYPMPVTVNAAFTCGASWNGTGILLGRAGSGCANLAELGDAIYHEYAHGLTQWIYGGNPADVGEGNSDVAAAFLTGDPIIAEGFFQGDCEHGLRDLRNSLQYPGDYIPGQPFHNGQIIAGFWWDAREGLIASGGEVEGAALAWRLWHWSRRHHQPVTMPDQVHAAFVEDDDDGDLSNRTPHYADLCAAAELHGFDCPELSSESAEPGASAADGMRLRCRPNPAAASAVVSYRVAGGSGRVSLTACDAAGRRVRTIVDGTTPGGGQEVRWDGTDDLGRPLPGGVYFVRLQEGGRRALTRIVFLRE
jgi:hypothetical protein